MLALFPGPFPAFQCCTLKSGKRAWYTKSRDGERRWEKVQSTSRVKGHQTCKRYSLQTTKDTVIWHSYIATIRVKCNPSRAQSLRFQLIECTESIKTARFIQPRLTYFSFASCHVNIDHHDMPHVTLRTRPSSHFSACNIEKLGMGLGTRLVMCKYKYAHSLECEASMPSAVNEVIHKVY